MEAPKTKSDTQVNSEDNQNDKNESKTEAWGYDLYPERRGTFTPKMSKILFGKEGKENIEKFKCEQNVVHCVKNSMFSICVVAVNFIKKTNNLKNQIALQIKKHRNASNICPIVKTMIAALKSSGCPIDIRRHISCEVCDYSVSGGYDPQLNQIVVCQNVSKKKGMVQGVLTHEMIHMFDYCKNQLDFRNMEHLACTEIRAANLTHCSFISAWSQGDASWTKIKKAHQDCVKTKALYSVMAVRQIGKAEAVDVIEKVFPKCYNDMEPLGRRIRRNSEDMFRVYKEASYYGYDS